MVDMALHILVLASLLMLVNATTVDNSDPANGKHEWMIPKRVKELEQNSSSQEELIQTLTRVLKDQCLAMEKWKYQARLMDNAIDQNRRVIDMVSASQISTYKTGYAKNTLNDIRSSYYDHGGCSHTGYDSHPWWQANLAFSAIVELVRMMNRLSSGSRLGNFKIQGFDLNPSTSWKEPKTCAEYRGTVRDGVTETVRCDVPITAKYIRLVKPSQFIQLCSFEVEGTPALDKTTASAIQSSTHPTEIESRAWRALFMYEKTCSQTDPEEDSDPWWQMKFEQTTTVRTVKITNRADDKYKWLKNIVVTVYERQPTSCTGEEDGRSTCATRDDVVSKGGTVTLTCDQPITGRYLRITKKITSGEALSLCKVIVN